ncbi:MAG: hypothetical protein JO002_08540 [Burkholderiaceae bacterium]|nr:hypothetical protein [Burkholderiaceae bacterium]
MGTNQWLAAAGMVLAGGVAAQGLPVKDALQDGSLGLFPAQDFHQARGDCQCGKLKQGMWYFQDDLVALPRVGVPQASYSTTLDKLSDIRQWSSSPEAQTLAYPSLLWLGSPQVVDGVSLSADGKSLKTAGGDALDFRVVPKIASNRSYYNDASVAFFANRPLRLRGKVEEEAGKPVFVARTVWPADFNIDADRLALAPPKDTHALTEFVQAEHGGAKSAFTTRLLWERHPGRPRRWQDKPVLGVMLNGAQGDDDEAYGGHFAIATGRMGAGGDWSNWIVNNFYNLDSYSEKGIIAASMPMDNYLMDLNSGQQYYRPSYMLVAVLNDARTAVAYQGAVERVYNHFYRHDFTYQHAVANCAGISLDVFKALGWNIPERGPSSWAKAIGAYFYLSAKDGSLESGRKIYDYLTEETTRLLPAVAFDAAGQDLLELVNGRVTRSLGAFEQQLQSDVEAIYLVRIPQVPSSRAFGSNPVFSFSEYMERAPADHAQWKIVPVDARPFPQELRDGQALTQQRKSPVPLPIAIIVLVIVAAASFVARALYRKRKR